MRREVCQFSYTGPINPNSATKPQQALTPESSRNVVLSAWYSHGGRIRPTGHFKMRAKQRRFSMLDCEEVIRCGKPLHARGIYCPKFKNYKYEFKHAVDGLRLRV